MSVPRETSPRLVCLVRLVLAESEEQNLISSGSVEQVWGRHVADSRQLLPYCAAGPLLDVGSGAGFPGLVLACERDDPVILVEPRARRAAFLARAANALGLANTTVLACKVERVSRPPVPTITARAVASLDRLFGLALHLANEQTRWVLPKGRTTHAELEAARALWHGEFKLVPSRTDPDAAIVLARGVARRSKA